MVKVNEARVKLHDDEIVEASLKGSSIHALGFPRSKRNNSMIKSTLSHKVGVYILIGRNKPHSAKLEVYIGHGTNISNRLSTHHSQKMIDNSNNWFETIVIFDSKGDMTVKNALAVEGSLIEACKRNNRWKTSNRKGASDNPDNEESYVADTIDKSIVLSRILGWDVFRDFREFVSKPTNNVVAKTPKPPRSHEVFMYQSKQFWGKMTVSGSGKIIVHQNSRANPNTTNSTSDLLKSIRKDLISQGVLIRVDDHLLFTRDYEFTNPSRAGSVIAGYGINGKDSWRLQDGTNYGDWLKRQ